MSNPCGQLPQGREFFGLHQLAFQLFAFVDFTLQGFAGLFELVGPLLDQLLELAHLHRCALGHFPFGGQGVGQLMDFDVVERFFQNQQPVMAMQPFQ